jgi:hypothetical protein
MNDPSRRRGLCDVGLVLALLGLPLMTLGCSSEGPGDGGLDGATRLKAQFRAEHREMAIVMGDELFQGGPRGPFSVAECEEASSPMSEGDIFGMELTFGSTIEEHEGSVDAYVAAVNKYRADVVATGACDSPQ